MSRDSKVVSFVKGSIILSIANLALKAVSFFLLPLYTNRLSPAEMGISDISLTVISFLFPILQFGLDSAFSAFFYDEHSEEHQTKVFNTVLFTVLLTSLIPIFACLFADNISFVLFQTSEYSNIIIAALLSVSIHLWFMPFPYG